MYVPGQSFLSQFNLESILFQNLLQAGKSFEMKLISNKSYL